MGRRVVFLAAVCTIASIGAPNLAKAQTVDASIIGRVTDESNLGIPGVTVTASSPALQVGQVTTVTDERGAYRLAPLPIGTYGLVYSLQGFNTVRQEGIRLTAGFVATINTQLTVGALEESITVTAAPTLDVTTTTATTRITKELLELLPSNRNGVLSMMALAPGLRGPLDIPSNFTAVPSFKSYGREGEQWSLLEGVLTAAPSGSSGAANYWDYTTFDETQVAGIGKGVESPIRGVHFAAIVKSGGNDFHGSFTSQGTNRNFQGNNIDDDLRARGITTGGRLDRQWDLGGDLGGRIIRDRLWFYGGLRKRLGANEITGVTDPQGNAVDTVQDQHFETIKSSWQTTPTLQFIGYYGRGTKGVDNDALTPFTAWDVRRFYWVEAHTQKLETKWVKGNSVVSLQTGAWIYQFAQETPIEPSVESRTRDLVTLRTTGNLGTSERLNNKEQGRYHQTGSWTWYKPDLFYGPHQLKVGFDHIWEYNRVIGFDRPNGNYIRVFSNGVPSQLITENAPILAKANANFSGVYLNDSWTVGDHLTINLGARYDRDALWVPEQCQEAGTFSAAACTDRIQRNTWNSLTPRLSVAWDVRGDGTSAVKAGYGRYVLMRNAGGGQFNNPFAGGSAGIGTTTWRWRDLNNDRQYQAGEVNLDPTGSDYISGINPFTFRGVLNPPDPGEEQPKEDQVFIGYERQIGADLSVRITGLYNRVIDPQRTVGIQRPYDVYNIPITRPDPGPDGVVGSADDPGATLTYFDYPAQFAGAQNSGLMRSNPPQPSTYFRTIEVAANKRFTRGWTINSSFSGTKAHEPFLETGSGGGGEGQVRPHTPNDEINIGNFGWEWTANIAFVKQLPLGMFVAANYQGRSGEKGARQVLLTGGARVPNLVMNAEPYGSLQLPAINTIDVRIDKKFSLGGRHSLATKVTFFNILNANTTLAWNVRSGPSFKLPTSILPARFVDFSATYSF